MNLEHGFVASSRARKRALRRRWNEIKLDEYRWWPEVSKEAFNTGLDGLGFWSLTVEVEGAVGVAGRPAHIEASAYPVVGVDLGVKTLATVCSPDGTVVHELPHHEALANVRTQRRVAKLCSGCGERKPSLRLAERTYTCERCGLVVDRDVNAAINLARLGEQARLAGSGPVTGRGANQKSEPRSAGGCETSTPHEHALDQTGTAPPQGKAA